MSYLFGTACLDLAREITDVMDSAATASGSTTPFITLIDTSMPIATPASDWYNNGTIFFTSGVVTTGNLGLTRRITDFDNGTGTFTFAAITARTVALDTYSVMTKAWPYYALRQAVNKALTEIGDVDKQDITTTAVTDQLSYTLPTGIFNIKKVELATSLTDPLNYIDLSHWHEVNGTIQFDAGHAPSVDTYILRLTYNVPPSEITADTTAIPTNINPIYLKWMSVCEAYRWRLHKIKNDDPTTTTMMNEALQKAEKKAAEHRPEMNIKSKQNQLSAWAVNSARWDTEPDPGTARLR
jgi:hypothetical protein